MRTLNTIASFLAYSTVVASPLTGSFDPFGEETSVPWTDPSVEASARSTDSDRFGGALAGGRVEATGLGGSGLVILRAVKEPMLTGNQKPGDRFFRTDPSVGRSTRDEARAEQPTG